MVMRNGIFRVSTLSAALMMPAMVFSISGGAAMAQAPAAAAGRQLGTVKAISGNSLTLATDAGQPVAISVADGVKVYQLEPGSTDLKTAKVIALTDIAVGDRVLVTGKAGEDASTFAASRVILMKSGDIAQKNAQEQADWQKRGSGGIVSSVDAGILTVTAGAKKIEVKTTPKTIFRRYAGDSVKFEDAVPGTLAQVQAGDQLRVRGEKSDDGSSIQAEEIVSGSFRNLSGTIATLDASGGSLTIKDLATKKTMTVKVTANSSVRTLPAEMGARLAARANGGGGRGGQAGGGGDAGGPPRGAGGPGGGRPGGGDLSQMVSRLPPSSASSLKPGDAVMIVASQADPGSSTVTAVTLLSGVDAILRANPNGSSDMTLSPWGGIGGAPGGGGEGGGPQ